MIETEVDNGIPHWNENKSKNKITAVVFECRLTLGDLSSLQTESIHGDTLNPTRQAVRLLLHSSIRSVPPKRSHPHSSKAISWIISNNLQKNKHHVVMGFGYLRVSHNEYLFISLFR